MFNGRSAIKLDLPANVQSTLPDGWFVELRLCGLKVLRLKENGWFHIQVHDPDGTVTDTATKIPVQDWGSTGMPQGVMVLLCTQKGGRPIGFFDIQNGTYTYLREEMWCRTIFDDINGKPRKKLGLMGVVGMMAGIDRSGMDAATGKSTSELQPCLTSVLTSQRNKIGL